MSNPMRAVVLAAVAWTCWPWVLLAQGQQGADRPRTGFVWRNRPTIQIGEHVRLDVRLKLAVDSMAFDPDIGEDEVDFRIRRWGLNGELGSHFEFQIERDFHEKGRWRDVFLNWRTFRQVQLTAGRFKAPIGREQLTGVTDVDFALRTLVSSTIPPARDKGVMVNGRFLSRGLTYEFGVFQGDGDNGRLKEIQFVRTEKVDRLGPSFAGRVTGTPLRPLGRALRTFRAGFAYGAVNMPEGLNSFRGESVYGTETFFAPVYVKGRRTRMATEVSYMPGPVGLTAEWMRASEAREQQGLGDVDLSDLLTTGWYASATWLVTGERKDGFERPRRALFRGGVGAIELAARYEKLQFESADKTGPAFTNPRAEHILGNSDSVWSFGTNWFVNRWVRITLNGIREEFEDASRTPEPGVSVFWSGIGRLQLVF
ncbi:MAG: OprO/OprP family phosphate-selective porin [Acidobacteriota bacterium]